MALTAYQARLSRRIWGRRPDRAYRFWFCSQLSPNLVIEPLNEHGIAAFSALVKRLERLAEAREIPAEDRHSGWVRVDSQSRYVFCSPTADEALLKELAGFAFGTLHLLPALSGLEDAGCASVQTTDDSVLELDLSQLDVHRDADLWSGLISPRIQDVEWHLATRMPGQRLFFWLWPNGPLDGCRLLVQPVENDPNTDVLSKLIQRSAPPDPGPTATGVAVSVDGGFYQLISHEADDRMLRALAEWTHIHFHRHPGLGRLRDAQLVRIDKGRVAEIFEDPSAWLGITSPLVPGTIEEAAYILDELKEGQSAWFWLAGTAEEPVFTASPILDDDDGLHFQDKMQVLAARLPKPNGISGVVQRLPSGALAFTTDEDPGPWGPLTQSLVEHFAPDYPVLGQVAAAKLVHMRDGALLGVH